MCNNNYSNNNIKKNKTKQTILCYIPDILCKCIFLMLYISLS